MQRNMKKKIFALLLLMMSSIPFIHSNTQEDNFRWLEEVDSDRALNWVKARNKPTLEFLSAQEGFEQKKKDALEILTASDRIVYGSIRGDLVYNFWQSATQPQGVWRRTSFANYKSGDYEWETVLDLDLLSEKEGIKWVWKGANFLTPTSNRCLIELSDGGKDAVEVREFDVDNGEFVEDGFFVAEAKTNVTWANSDAIWLATRFDDDAVTESGYPRVLKLLKRGQNIEDATEVYATDFSHMSINPVRYRDGNATYAILVDRDTFFTKQYFLIEADNLEQITELPIQKSDVLQTIFAGQCVVQTREPWNVHDHTYPAGSLLSFDLAHFLEEGTLGDIQELFTPSETVAIKEISRNENSILVNFNDNVTNRVSYYRFKNGEWTGEDVSLPENGTIELTFASSDTSIVYLGYENFLTPDSLIELDTKTGEWQTIQSLPSRFDSSDLVAEQRFATSKDGTQVPYFIVHKKGIKLDGNNATFLYGYGGFEISMNPFYLSSYGKLWVEPGNVFVLANIRGGGEFGPRWHQAALKHNRQRAFDDFHAIAEDLIEQKITSPKHLGIGGGSNGGLLVGVAFTQRPDLYNAVFCSVPLLDMLRYHELPPGASWIAEYGDPRIKEDYDYIATYSPYQNLSEDAEYPKVFFYTSTRDDRVHPGHARKMAAKMEEMGHPFFYFERIEGGHSGGANLTQYAELYALEFSYLKLLLKGQ